MTEETRFSISTTTLPLLRTDGRRHFARRRPISVRLLEWTIPALWILGTAVGLATAF